MIGAVSVRVSFAIREITFGLIIIIGTFASEFLMDFYFSVNLSAFYDHEERIHLYFRTYGRPLGLSVLIIFLHKCIFDWWVNKECKCFEGLAEPSLHDLIFDGQKINLSFEFQVDNNPVIKDSIRHLRKEELEKTTKKSVL